MGLSAASTHISSGLLDPVSDSRCSDFSFVVVGSPQWRFQLNCSGLFGAFTNKTRNLK